MEEQSTPSSVRSYNASDPADFKAIYKETFKLLYTISWRVVNDEEAAEDLVHDSYIKANSKGMVFPSMDDAKFWLIRVVKNASLNYAMRKTREGKAYHKAFYEDTRKIETGEQEVLKTEARKKAVDALNKLPKKLREVLILKEYGDLNYKEIGKILGITEGNVKVRVFRAREKLENLIGDVDSVSFN
ncbi:MAG: sigma-70 family RNA polymerase sigma factor [Treponema sp.]|nr:sigma-70 family RNA polymerase sigma factor [Treponema sp.]MBR6912553.1 sigma-70 family RNA polymerase sigma factor [Treponema sp.]MCR5126107.1 sigma-70 family RNA polymerase sigma factor [Treponema sp.]